MLRDLQLLRRIRTTHGSNLLFQSERPPLVRSDFETEEDYCRSLIHKKPYERAAAMGVDRDVLDIGCNIGYGTKIMSGRCRSITGVDVSERAIAAARRMYGSANVEFQVVDGNSLPFADRSFDLATSFQVIEHVVNVDAYLSEIKRVLRDDGIAIFTTPNRMIRLDPGMKPWNRYHVREYAADELEACLAKVFPQVEVQGLFAKPDLYDVEYARVQRSKLAARRGRGARRLRGLKRLARRRLIEAQQAVLLDGVVRNIQESMRRARGHGDGAAPAGKASTPSPAKDFLRRWTSEDLVYQQDHLDRALDLIVICHKKAGYT